MKVKKTLFSIFTVILVLSLFGCGRSANTEKTSVPAITIASTLQAYRGITYGQFKEQSGLEAELLHAMFWAAELPAAEAEIIFLAETFDEDAAMNILTEDDLCVRIQGRLGEIMDGLTEEMEVEEFIQKLSWFSENLPDYSYGEGAGTAYYVGNRYLIVELDSDGDAVADVRLEISLDESEKVEPDSYAWLYWMEE